MEYDAFNMPIDPGSRRSDAGNLPFVLTPPDVREFQRLIQEHCGVSLSETEAWNRATELVALYRMFLGPIPEDPIIVASGIEVSGHAEP